MLAGSDTPGTPSNDFWFVAKKNQRARHSLRHARLLRSLVSKNADLDARDEQLGFQRSLQGGETSPPLTSAACLWLKNRPDKSADDIFRAADLSPFLS